MDDAAATRACRTGNVWRALQLFIDLPHPLLHPFVALAALTAALWLAAGNPLAIETSAPELHKRGT
jgi:hypothetical protein